MKRIRFRRITASVLALLIVTGTAAVPTAFDGTEQILPVFTASAEGESVSFDAESGVLTLQGEITKAEVQRFKEKAVSVVASEGTILPQYTSGLFRDFEAVESIDLTCADTSACSKMEVLFAGCKKLTSVTFGENFDTSGVTLMGGMFRDCTSLETLDLRPFDTSNAGDLSEMFSGCTALTTIWFGTRFQVRSAGELSGMFSGCTALTTLDLSGFQTKAVRYTKNMFSGCANLKQIIVGDGWKLGEFALDNDADMFRDCTSLPHFDADAVNSAHADTSETGYLTTAQSFDAETSVLTLRGHVARENVQKYAQQLVDGTVTPSAVTAVVTEPGTVFPEDSSALFRGFDRAASIDLTGADTWGVRDMSELFAGCELLPTLDLTAFDTRHVTSMEGMFDGCKALNAVTFGENFRLQLSRQRSRLQ